MFIILFTLLFYLISVGSRLFLGLSIGINLPPIQLGGIILLVNFLILVPITISGIGVRETGYVMLLGLAGIKPEQALLLSFLDFMISISGVLIGGGILLWENIISHIFKFKKIQ